MADYDDLPLPHSDKLAKGVILRRATKDDIKGLSKSFFNSFSPSHEFWRFNFPEHVYYDWWLEAWRMGIEDDASDRTYIAVDSSVSEADAGEYAVAGGRIIGFTRWIVPQPDGNLHRGWPDLPEGANLDVLGPFFGNMEVNRQQLMGSKPHWFLELLATDINYRRTGVGYAFVDWGCRLADKEDMEVYIDASPLGAPFYQKHFGAVPRAAVDLPDRPEYPKFEYISHVRPSLSARQKDKS